MPMKEFSDGARPPRNGRRAAAAGAVLLWAALVPSPGLRAEEAMSQKGVLKPGAAAPSFRLRALDGAMVRLDELAYPGKEKAYAKKKPIFLDFFRTDCLPCRGAIPDLIKLHQRYQPEGIEFILIALLEEEDGRSKLERFLIESKVPFRVVVDEAEHFSKKYLGDPVTLPATFLIDENGIVRKTKYGAAGTYQDHFGTEIETLMSAWKGGNPAGGATPAGLVPKN